jgi:hypothetical protein
MHDDAPLFEIAASEIASGTPDRGIFAKAFSAALGDEPKTRALYIQFRVEQLKSEIARRSAEEARLAAKIARRKVVGRKEYLSVLREEFGYILRMTIPESDSPSSMYAGEPQSLAAAVRLSDVSEALGILEFRLVDAVKTGAVEGIIDRDGDWWIAAKNG